MALRVWQSYGDVLDRITILEIKVQRIRDAQKRAHAAKELQVLEQAWLAQSLPPCSEQRAQLRAVNQSLWTTEDRLRVLESQADFGPEFVAQARSVYQVNDQRAKLKNQVNQALGSALLEVKEFSV